MAYYIFVENGKINGAGQCKCLTEGFENIEVMEETYNDFLKDKIKYRYNNGNIELNPDYEDEKALIEHARIQELSMTRSDFFDGTIKAFGMTKEALQVVISKVLDTMQIDPTTKLIALNNYENALNFYRKHALFTILSNVELPIGVDGTNMKITSEQFDKFFDETNKKNPDAYVELLPKEEGE
jgi:hypothetical protein